MKNIEYIYCQGGIYLEVRKLIKFGNSSHVISLPGTWLKKNKLNKGDLIYFKQNNNNELVLTPQPKEEKKEEKNIVISTDNKKFSRIQRELISAYLNDYREIKFIGKNIPEVAKDLRESIHNLMALEIIEQNSEVITTRDLLNLEEVSLYDMAKRMDIIGRAMLSDLISSKGKIETSNFFHRDEDINRIYFAAMRTIHRALSDPNFATKIKLSNGELMRLWHVIHHIEIIADQVKFISKLMQKLKSNNKELDRFFGLLRGIEKFYISTLKSFYLNNLEEAYNQADMKDVLISNIEKEGSSCKGNLCACYERLKNIVIETHKIGRRVYS